MITSIVRILPLYGHCPAIIVFLFNGIIDGSKNSWIIFVCTYVQAVPRGFCDN